MKLKEKTKKRIRGSITVLLVIILLPMMTFSAMIADMSRLNMAKAMMSSAGDLAMNTALANYDTILKDVYGLFAMSQGKSQEELNQDIQDYFEKTMVQYGVVSEEEAGDYVGALLGDVGELVAGVSDTEFTDFLEVQNLDVTTTGVEGSGLDNPEILRKQLVEYMKYRAPVELGMSFLDSLKIFKNTSQQTAVVEKQVQAQESTQDVAQACTELMKLIREYDALVESINSGAKAVTGLDKSGDTSIVPLEDYGKQADKYRTQWEDDYQHINKLNLVFQANVPSVSDIYLSKMDYDASQWFIKLDNTMVFDNCGIGISVQTASDLEGAKNKVNEQIGVLADGSQYQNTATAYVNKNYINSGLLKNDLSSFSNEDEAISTFVEFEKFLLDQGDLTYTSVKSALEQLYTLGKYYSDFSSKVNSAISEANTRLQNARSAVSSADTNAYNYERWNGDMIDDVNTALNEKPADDSSVYSYVSKTVYNEIAKPGTTTVGGRTFVSYSADYYSGNFTSGGTNKFLKAVQDYVNHKDLKNNAFAKAVKSYLDSKMGGFTDDYSKFTDFRTFMSNKDVRYTTEGTLFYEHFQAINVLIYCAKRIGNLSGNIKEYVKIRDGYQEKINEQANAQADYDAKVKMRDDVTRDYKACLAKYQNFTTSYQADAYAYGSFIATAQNIIAAEADRIKTQFNSMESNLKELETKLGAIEKQIEVTKTAIQTYQQNVDNWETENNKYAAASDGDSFSKQSAADIEKARTEYNEDSFNTLEKFVVGMKGEIKDFRDYFNDDTHYKYGSKKIGTISTAADLKTAASSVVSSLGNPVTAEDAQSKFDSLYNADTAPEFVPYTYCQDNAQQLTFLDPVLPINILKYLNSAYPDSSKTVDTTAKTDYETQKGSLISGSGESLDEDAAASGTDKSGNPKSLGADKEKSEEKQESGKYGYTYKNNKVEGENLPSNGTDAQSNSGKEYQMANNTEDANDVDVSSGMSEQKGALDSILGNIGSALTAGLENAYILTYIFENFSYNTMVQEALLKQEEADTYGSAKKAMGKTLEDTNVPCTLSNMKKNAANNYLYGAEVEYILYGNKNPSTNVTYAKGSIYAIRFAFNCIYAFTNTEIRNLTMSAGLAVQAATLGFVPYQIVQIVLQLALAAAESALDLDMMNCGMKVAVVKSKGTWICSPSGIAEQGKSMVSDVVTTGVNKVVEDGVKAISGGLQDLVDKSAEEVQTAAQNAGNQLKDATDKVVRDFLDQVSSAIMSEVEDALNSLQFVGGNGEATSFEEVRAGSSTEIVEDPQALIDSLFQDIRDGLHSKMVELSGSNQLLIEISSTVEAKAIEVIDGMEQEVEKVLTEMAETMNPAEIKKQFTSMISEKMTEMKTMLANKASEFVSTCVSEVSGKVTETVAAVQTQINSKIREAEGKITKDIQDQVTATVNGYIDSYVDVGNSTAIGGKTGTGSDSNSVASIVRFGYKEYMMLFTYIAICANDDAVLKRTADIIQLNISKAGDGAEFKHSKGGAFTMKNAKTYVTVVAEGDLDMFFMDLDLFANMVTTDDTGGETGNSGSHIYYRGVLGY